MKLHAGVLVAGLALATVVHGTSLAEEPAPFPFLRNTIGLDAAQRASVEKGEVVTKLLPSTDKSEVAAFGVVKSAGIAEALLSLARDVRGFRKGPRIVEMGVFHEPARSDDLAGLTWPPDDLAALRKCKPGSCDVKLGTRGLELIARVGWAAADADRQASAILNAGIVEYVGAYQKGGLEALGDVIDKKDARSRAAEHRAILGSSPYLAEYVKAFGNYLAAFPAAPLPGAENVFYWMKDTSGPKPVIAAYHAVAYRGPHGVLVANRLLGASHFFNAGLEVTAAVPSPDGKGLYLMALYRIRLDPPTGMLSGTLMAKIKGGIEAGVRESLGTLSTRLTDRGTN